MHLSYVKQRCRPSKLAPFFVSLGMAAALSLAGGAKHAWSQPLLFSELRVLIEINATDGDAGFQAKIDGDGWKRVALYDPLERRIYEVKGYKSVREQGLTESFFESAEPSCDEVSLDDVLARFPAGDYDIEGRSIDNEPMEGEATLTHALPGAPENLAPHMTGDIDPTAIVKITWSAGGTLGNCPPEELEIQDPGTVGLFGFQVVAQRVSPGPSLEFVTELSGAATEVTLPPQFMQNNAIYKFEIVAIEDRAGARGNQTISEGFFCTQPIATVDCELPD